MNALPVGAGATYGERVDPRDAASGASALPVAVLLALVEPALGLIAGFAVFLAVERVPLRVPRLRLRTPRPVVRRPRALRLGR